MAISVRDELAVVRGRIDWKYALGLELTDPGFDHSVMAKFRSRLVAHGLEEPTAWKNESSPPCWRC